MGLQLTGGAGVSTSYHFCGLFVIGVTGGIATGKSSLVSLLRAKGSGVVDADRLGHEVYNVGTPAYKKILEVCWSFPADLGLGLGLGLGLA